MNAQSQNENTPQHLEEERDGEDLDPRIKVEKMLHASNLTFTLDAFLFFHNNTRVFLHQCYL